MNFIYGFYTLDMDDTDYNTLLNNIINRLIASAPMNGFPLTDYETYQTTTQVGYAILSKDGVPKGIGYKTETSDRIWFIEDGDVYKLFIDAKPDLVRYLDLSYLPTNKEVIWNLNGQTVIENFA